MEPKKGYLEDAPKKKNAAPSNIKLGGEVWRVLG